MKPLQIEGCIQHTFVCVMDVLYFKQQQVMTVLHLLHRIKVITECALVMNTEFKQNQFSYTSIITIDAQI